MSMPKIFARRTLGTVIAIICLVIGGRLVILNLFPNAFPQNSPGYAGGGQLQSADLGVTSAGVATELSPQSGVLENAKTAVSGAMSPAADYAKPTMMPRPYPVPPDYYGTANITDTREYLKMSYYARVKALHPDTLAERAQISIRGLQGRIDNSNISQTGAYISFVVPKNNIQALRDEVKGLAGAKFVDESVSSQNLLPQKQQIEGSTASNQTALDKQTADKADLTTKHNDLIKSITADIAKINNAIASLNTQARNTTDTVRLAAIANEKAANLRLLNSANQRLNDENTSYGQQLANANRQIEYLNQALTGLAKQDVNLTNNVETVQGSISFIKTSYWGMLDTYVNGYLAAITWLVIGLVIFFVARRGGPKAEVQPVQ